MNTQIEASPRRLSHRLGIILAAVYFLLAAVVFALIASQPPDDGLEWLPTVWLSMPWFKLGDRFLIPGILINTVLLYFFGVAIQLAYREFRASAKSTDPPTKEIRD
jgi:hypothetical protein